MSGHQNCVMEDHILCITPHCAESRMGVLQNGFQSPFCRAHFEYHRAQLFSPTSRSAASPTKSQAFSSDDRVTYDGSPSLVTMISLSSGDHYNDERGSNSAKSQQNHRQRSSISMAISKAAPGKGSHTAISSNLSSGALKERTEPSFSAMRFPAASFRNKGDIKQHLEITEYGSKNFTQTNSAHRSHFLDRREAAEPRKSSASMNPPVSSYLSTWAAQNSSRSPEDISSNSTPLFLNEICVLLEPLLKMTREKELHSLQRLLFGWMNFSKMS